MSLHTSESSDWQCLTPAGPPKKDQTSTSFRGGRAPRANDVFIAVMGVTGSGKSSFISTCSGKTVKVGHALTACTATVDVYAYEVSSTQTVYLIDTPGFDDTSRSDTDVLREIAAWLGDSYMSKIRLHGIIYLHRITDVRMQGSAKRNLVMFKQLCGQDALKKVILTTTMWDKVSADEGIRREGELKDTPEFWGWMLQKGSACHRYDNTEESARRIVASLANHGAPITTDLQRELVDENKPLGQTSAGQELESEMRKQKDKWEEEKREIEEEMQLALQQRDHEAEEELREVRNQYAKMIEKIEEDNGGLEMKIDTLLADRDRHSKRMKKLLKEQQAAGEGLRRRNKELTYENKELKKALEVALDRLLLENKRKKEERREREKKKEEERRKKRQKEQSVPRPGPYNMPDPGQVSPFSLSLSNGSFTCISDWLISSNTRIPRELGSEILRCVSYGDVDDDGDYVWLAGYTGGKWVRSVHFDLVYPGIASLANIRGLDDLELCSLGPRPTYVARWRNGDTYIYAPNTTIEEKFRDVQKAGKQIQSVALGKGGSYIMSYGVGSMLYWSNLGAAWDLKGYYPGLDAGKYLRDNDVVAAALDISNGTDFEIISKKKYWSQRSFRHSYQIKNKSSAESVEHWWKEVASL